MDRKVNKAEAREVIRDDYGMKYYEIFQEDGILSMYDYDLRCHLGEEEAMKILAVAEVQGRESLF